MTWAEVAERLSVMDGCGWRRDLVRTRSDGRALALAVTDGRVLRAGRGLYALPGAGVDVVTARGLGGRLTCVSALAALGVPLLVEPAAPHVWLSRRRGARPERREGVVMHQSSWPSSGRGSLGAPGALAPPVLALVHAVACLSRREAVAAVDAALRLRLVTAAELAAARPPRGRRAVEDVLRYSDAGAGSLPESLVRLAMVDAGLRVRTQARIAGVGRVDLLVEGCVVVEVDGYTYHSDRRAFAEDRRRDRVAQAGGFVVLRYTYDDAVHRTDALVAEVARHCGRGAPP